MSPYDVHVRIKIHTHIKPHNPSFDDNPKDAAQKIIDNRVFLIVGEGRLQSEFVNIADVYVELNFFDASTKVSFLNKTADVFPANYCTSLEIIIRN